MKKVFLLAGMAAVGMTAMAEVPKPMVIDNDFLYALSANGKYAVATDYSTVTVYDLVSDTIPVIVARMGETDMGAPACGNGKCVSNDGVMVGSSDGTVASYLKNGKWVDLPVPEAANGHTCVANAITPDGSVICGSIGLAPMELDGDHCMQNPVVWVLGEDGTYGDPIMLPCPEKDFTGLTPQYVLAEDISDDGTRVVGQVISWTGMVAYPLIFTCENGEWSYEIVHAKDLKPSTGEYPEYPGDAPVYPQAETYMTEADMEAYMAAYEAYVNSGYDWSLHPNEVDYLSPDAKEAYDAAMKAYNKAYEKWEEEFYTWYGLQDEILAKVPFMMNTMKISPDGSYFGGTVEVSEVTYDYGWPMFTQYYNVWTSKYGANNRYVKYSMKNIDTEATQDDLNLLYLANKGVGLASTSIGNGASQSWVLKEGFIQDLMNYMEQTFPLYADWMKENLTFTYETFDMATFEPVEKTETMTGRAIGTPDLSTIAVTLENVGQWDYDEVAYGNAYVFKVADAIAGVGNVKVENNVENTIYDLQGRKLNNVTAPGIYIVNGEKKVVR